MSANRRRLLLVIGAAALALLALALFASPLDAATPRRAATLDSPGAGPGSVESPPARDPLSSGAESSASPGRRRAAIGVAPHPVVPEVARIPTTEDFTTTQLEHYLTNEGIAFIRPGLKIKINSIEIPADRRPVVDITVTDDFNNPLDRLGQITPGAISISFVLSRYDPDTREYVPYTTRMASAAAGTPNFPATVTQASADSGGTWTNLEMGHYTYRFRTALPADFPASATHTLGIYASRNLSDFVDKTYYANVVHDFRPDGQPVTVVWDKINQETSCLNCHDELAFHGGSRRQVELCVLCHNDTTVDPDTGESVDMEYLIHSIHMGENRPDPYVIIGFRGSVHDYSHVLYPQDIRNCQNCHAGTVPNQRPSQWDYYFTFPNSDACTGCHSDVNPLTGENHPGGAQPNSACASCHQPDGPEFGASVLGAHTIPTKSSQLAGLNIEVVSVNHEGPGSRPTVVFRITNDDGTAVDGTKLSTFAPILAGPTSSYDQYYREDARSTAVFDAASGTTTYTFTNMLPQSSSGTWVISADVYRMVSIVRADGEPPISVREVAFNPIRYFAVTGTTVIPRRTVVTLAQCNACHDTLALHGGQRMNTQECIICHNPHQTDVSRRPAAAAPPESVSFQYMIHRIHMGEELQNEFTVYGFGGRPHTYNHVLFPGNQADCVTCHVNNTQQLPPPPSADPVTVPRFFFSPIGSGTAACLGCHDSRDAAAHAFLNTAYFPGSEDPAESCAVCHGPGADWSVDRVHAQ